MVSHLSKDFSANPTEPLNLSFPLKLLKKSTTLAIGQNQELGGVVESHGPPNRMNWMISGSQGNQPEELLTGIFLFDGKNYLVYYNICFPSFPVRNTSSAYTFLLFH